MNETIRTASLPADQAALEQNRRTSLFRGLAAGGVLAAIGLLAVFSPLVSGVALAYLITAGLDVFGAAQIAAWVKTAPEERSVDLLVNGILLAGFSLFTLWASFQTSFGLAGMIGGLSVAAAFLTLLRGIDQFFAFSRMRREAADGAGWMLAAGVLNALLAMVILANPLMSWFALSTVWGVYLGASGVALAAEAFASSRGKNAA